MKSPGADNTFIVFGEAKIQDFTSGLAQQEASQFNREKPVATETSTQEAPKTETKAEAGKEEEVSEEGLDPATIEMVVNHTKCTRAEAVKALRETGGDSVTAIIVRLIQTQF